jgi:PAS domain S-box-containing protein
MTSLLGRNGFMPHGYCLAWKPALLWSMVGADALIALAYFSIPLALITFARRRKDPYVRRLVTLFSAFIFACGLTHVMDVWTIWQPDYTLLALSKGLTALVSLGTALVLWRLIPEALKIPSVRQLQGAIGSLEAQVQQRRLAEANLADTQEALLITLASIGGGFMSTDREGRVTRMNTVAEQITGWAQQQALGQSLWTVFQREDRNAADLARNPVDVLASTGATIDKAHDVVAISRLGVRTPVEVKASLTYAPDGSVRGLAMVFRDMSTINAAQAQVGQLAAIVASSQDAIIGKTLDGHITSWNDGAQALFGYSAQQAIGQPVQMLLPPDREQEEMRILAQLAAGTRVAPFETQRRHRDGSLVDVSVTISPIQDAQGHIVGASKIARDISMQKQAEQLRIKGQQLEAENRQILEASRLKSEFLANMSHELRTPLNAIIGFADLLHSGAVPATSSKHQVFLGHIGTSGRHLLQLINDVLDLSKVESGKLSFHPEPVHLPTLAREVSDILHTTASRNGVRMLTEIDPLVSDLELDPARLKQVLYNYLSNAIKFTPAGGLVTLRALPEGSSQVRIEVQDTGIGIAPSDLSRLFVEFQQLDSGLAKQHAGTGLGLALTRRLVQAQGGTVGVRSTPGQGSVFHVVIDRVCRPLPDAPASERSEAASPVPAHSRAPRRILVIEDNAQDRLRIQDALTQAGFTADTAQNAQEALARASTQLYDAITLGLVLQDRAGLELLSSIRSVGPSRAAPVVAVTMVAEQGSGARFPIADVLAKPIDAQQVVSALSQVHLPTGHRPTRVMVVDDDPTALALMSATLAPLGVHPICLDDGRRALREMGVHRPDAIILDLMMPGFDGFSVLDGLLQMPEWRHTPVFIWTSMLLTDDEYALLAQSARAILSKGGGALQALLEDLRRWRPRHGTTVATGVSDAPARSAAGSNE